MLCFCLFSSSWWNNPNNFWFGASLLELILVPINWKKKTQYASVYPLTKCIISLWSHTALCRTGKLGEGRKMWDWRMFDLIQLLCRECQSEHMKPQHDIEMLSRLNVYTMKISPVSKGMILTLSTVWKGSLKEDYSL